MERERQIAAINVFYDQTINKDRPQVAEYVEADIPKAILTQQYVFIYEIDILPDEKWDSFDFFYTGVKYGNWYDNITATGIIRFEKNLYLPSLTEEFEMIKGKP